MNTQLDANNFAEAKRKALEEFNSMLNHMLEAEIFNEEQIIGIKTAIVQNDATQEVAKVVIPERAIDVVSEG